MSSPGPVEQLTWAAIARRYFLEQKTKIEIADEFGITRFRVARILQSCIEDGIVTITVSVPTHLDAELSDRLRDRFGLRQAVVVKHAEDGGPGLRSALGRIAAELIGDWVMPGDVLGLTWGRTLDAMAPALQKLALCDVVQMTGVAGMTANSVELVKHVAAVSGGVAYPIYAPLVVSDASVARLMESQPMVSAAMHEWPKITRAAISIGSWSPPDSQFFELLSPRERRDMSADGVVAEIGSTFFAADGTIIDSSIEDRCISMSLDQMRSIGNLLAVAGGRAKHRAVSAVLRSGLVTGLVTDDQTARFALGSS